MPDMIIGINVVPNVPRTVAVAINIECQKKKERKRNSFARVLYGGFPFSHREQTKRKNVSSAILCRA